MSLSDSDIHHYVNSKTLLDSTYNKLWVFTYP